jgi:hypothetical protein
VCCDLTGTLDLPPEVIETLAAYRRMLALRPLDWGDEQIGFFQLMRFAQYGEVMDGFMSTGDVAKAVAATIADDVPAGIVGVSIDPDRTTHAHVGPPRMAIAGRTVRIDVVVSSAVDAELDVRIGDTDVRLAANGAAVRDAWVDGADPVVVVALGDEILRVEGAVRVVPGAEIVLESSRCSRWSVTDASGGAWFPDGVLQKWDLHDRPFFHGHDVVMRVPAEPLEVVCTRGLEFDRTTLTVTPQAGASTRVECEPVRLHDPAADGWYGGDMHVHMNYSGDLVCTPGDAALMQFGEGLHLVNLVAANCLTSLIYDRDMLERYPGVPLPWSTDETVAQMGVEYRNDLLGHVHALGPRAPPSRYCTGHERSDNEDWPPNSAGCEELRSLGATIGYCHPVMQEFPEDGSPRRFFRVPRSVEARELVADAALGLIDSVDLISPANSEGSTFLYHRLLSSGLRLAATAGTDTFLSFSHAATFSNPPGFGRVYANLDGEPLTVDAFKDAIRAARTVVTNGPWITIDVDGRGPGDVVDASTGATLRVTACVTGLGVEKLSLVGPDGEIARSDGEELSVEVTLEHGPLWIAAIARGPVHPSSLGPNVFAHTSPVWIDVDGVRVARPTDAQWCLDFLDSLQQLASEHGHYAPETREAHLGDVIAVLDQARAFYRAIAG